MNANERPPTTVGGTPEVPVIDVGPLVSDLTVSQNLAMTPPDGRRSGFPRR